MKRILRLVCAIGALSAVCGPAWAQDLKKVTLLTDFLFSGTHTPYFAGVAQGKFRDVGLDVTIQPGKSSTDGAGQLAAGAVQFAVLDPVPALLAISKGAELSFVAVYWQRNPNGFCYLKDKHPALSFNDLDKVKIGGVNGDSIVITLRALTPGKTLNVITLEGASHNAALISGQVDAISCSVGSVATRAALAKQAGHDLGIVTFEDGGLNSIGKVVVVATSLLKQNPDLIKRFVLGFAESVAWSVANPEAAAGDLVKARAELKADAVLTTWQAFLPFLFVPGKDWFKFDPAASKATVELANKAYGINLTDAAFNNEFASALPARLLEGKP